MLAYFWAGWQGWRVMSQLKRAERMPDVCCSLPRASIKQCYSERWKDCYIQKWKEKEGENYRRFRHEKWEYFWRKTALFYVQWHICPSEDTVLIVSDSFSFVKSQSGFNNQGALCRTLHCGPNYSASLCTPIHSHLTRHNAHISCFVGFRLLFSSSHTETSLFLEGIVCCLCVFPALWCGVFVEAYSRIPWVAPETRHCPEWLAFSASSFQRVSCFKETRPQAFGLDRGWNIEISALMPFKDNISTCICCFWMHFTNLKHYSIES